jgi:hypothetical protein
MTHGANGRPDLKTSEHPMALLHRVAMPAVSLYILFVLGMQTEEVLQLFASQNPGYSAPYFWPFMDYPMYSPPYYEGSGHDQHYVVGIREDMSEVSIHPDDLGLNFWRFRNSL